MLAIGTAPGHEWRSNYWFYRSKYMAAVNAQSDCIFAYCRFMLVAFAQVLDEFRFACFGQYGFTV